MRGAICLARDLPSLCVGAAVKKCALRPRGHVLMSCDMGDAYSECDYYMFIDGLRTFGSYGDGAATRIRNNLIM